MLNCITIMGQLIKEPELKRMPSGLAICNISFVCDRNVKKGNKPSLFMGAKFFGNTADNVAKFFKKGDPIIVTGRLENDVLESKTEPGKKTTIYYIDGVSFDFPRLSKDRELEEEPQPKKEEGPIVASGGLESLAIKDDELPW